MEKEKHNEFKIIFGEKLRYLRELAAMTQMELALRLGYDSSGTISQIERGHRGMSKERMHKVAEIFGIHPALLFAPKKFTKEQMDMSLNLMIIIGSDHDSPHIEAVKSLLKLAAEDISNKEKIMP